MEGQVGLEQQELRERDTGETPGGFLAFVSRCDGPELLNCWLSYIQWICLERSEASRDVV